MQVDSNRPSEKSVCELEPSRRDALRLLGLGVLVGIAPERIHDVELSEPANFESLIPVDKKLSPQWLRSLFARGTPAVYDGPNLKFIGMPVGGLTTGQLYLGGDGRLWHWDIFNKFIFTDQSHYAKPMIPSFPLEQGFVLRIADRSWPIDSTGFSRVQFRGQYPIGVVDYEDNSCPLAVTLEAYSPFVPLNVDDSSLPATVLQFTFRNTGPDQVEARLEGRLENGVCLYNRQVDGLASNAVLNREGFSFLRCSVGQGPRRRPEADNRPDLSFEDWGSETYGSWKVEGPAFGRGPILKSRIPHYQGDVGGDTERVVNSHATAPGNTVSEKDDATGKLTSKPFTIERDFIRFWIGGGNHPGSTCINLVVDGKVVHSTTGKNSNRMSQEQWNVQSLAGKNACIEIVDAQEGAWANIGVGKITFSDRSLPNAPLESLHDFGTMGLALLGSAADFRTPDQSAGLETPIVGMLGRHLSIPPGQSAVVTFVLCWHFPNLTLNEVKGGTGRYYVTRFTDAAAVADYMVKNFDRLNRDTRLWRDTWYDSTLPHWFLDRTFLNISILATSTAYRFANGRFYGWEGVGDCPGTCTHVWQYEQAMGRLFPELDVLLRERAEFSPDIGMNAEGMIDRRGEFHSGPAIDGQAGTILRAYRDHLTSVDHAFLNRNWPAIKKATNWLISRDTNRNGILEGPQHNTLDTSWFGPVAWLSGMYLASLRAAEEMALLIGDTDFARQCRDIFNKGSTALTQRLFNGEYYCNIIDPHHPESINSGSGCEIDQMLGQSWAWQVAIGRVFPEKEAKTALKSLWKYNFAPDVGPYRAMHKPGRWYAMPGEAGLLMCTFPRPDWSYEQAKGKGPDWAAGYFNECMNGFEHQVAGHMIWEGLITEGLAVERALHDRYHPSRRNPYNEVECGDHYARSMASYGVFIAACGFEYDGPKGRIGFAPRLSPENFKAAFTGAQGWGSYTQVIESGKLSSTLSILHGQIALKEILFAHPASSCRFTGPSGAIAVAVSTLDGKTIVKLPNRLILHKGEKIEVTIS